MSDKIRFDDDFYKCAIAILSGLLWIFELVYMIGSFSAPSLSPVYEITKFVIVTAVLVAICVLLYTDKESEAIVIGKMLIAYYIVARLLAFGRAIAIVYASNTAIYKTAAVFELIANIGIIITIALVVYEQVSGKEEDGFIFFSLGLFVIASLVAMILFMCTFKATGSVADFGDFGFSFEIKANNDIHWTYYIGCVIDYALIPWLACTGYYFIKNF